MVTTAQAVRNGGVISATKPRILNLIFRGILGFPLVIILCLGTTVRIPFHTFGGDETFLNQIISKPSMLSAKSTNFSNRGPQGLNKLKLSLAIRFNFHCYLFVSSSSIDVTMSVCQRNELFPSNSH